MVLEHFVNEEEMLLFYKKELPKRTKGYRLSEIGPVMSYGTDKEIEGYAEGKFWFNGKTDGPYVDMTEKLNWYAAPGGDLEWNGGLVRQGHVLYLADQYEKAKNEKYAEAAIRHMLDYIQKVRPFEPEGKPYLEYKKSTWRPFEAAGRAAENWPPALAKLIFSPYMTASRFAEILHSIYEHAVFLSKHHWQTGNHAVVECGGLGVIALLFPEFDKSREWLLYSIHYLTDFFDKTFFDDGYTKEMSGAYHLVAIRNFLALYQVAETNGQTELFPAQYKDWLQKAATAEFYQQKPDFSLPVTNDSNTGTNHKSALERLKPFIGEDLVNYRLTGKGQEPPNNSYFFKNAMLAVMRSSWEQDAVYLSLDMGPWGENHMNQDQLNIEVSAFGKNFIANSGRWRYTTSPQIDWRDKAQYFKSSFAYSTVVVDGCEQMPDDAHGTMKIHNHYVYACGIYDKGYGKDCETQDEEALKTRGQTAFKKLLVKDATHKREVIFVDNRFFIVIDTILCGSEHSAEQIWHFTPMTLEVSENKKYACSNFEDANIIVACINGEIEKFEGSEAPFRGWHCPEYDVLLPAPELSIVQSGHKEIVFETLIMPIKGKAEEIPLFEKQTIMGETVYTVSYQNKTYQIYYNSQKGLYIRL